MKTYRCKRTAARWIDRMALRLRTGQRYKHAVEAIEALRWIDTDQKREEFAAWFDRHDAMFETRGPVVVLPEEGTAAEGQWILCLDGEFLAMEDDLFIANYEEIAA